MLIKQLMLSLDYKGRKRNINAGYSLPSGEMQYSTILKCQYDIIMLPHLLYTVVLHVVSKN